MNNPKIFSYQYTQLFPLKDHERRADYGVYHYSRYVKNGSCSSIHGLSHYNTESTLILAVTTESFYFLEDFFMEFITDEVALAVGIDLSDGRNL